MSAEPMPIINEARLVGPAAILDEMSGADDAAVAAAIEKRMNEYGIAVPGELASASLRRLVDRLRGRRLLEDFGVHQAQVEWLRFHVPPGGTARLTLERKAERTGGVTLKFMGLGFGSGRSVALGAEHDFGDRTDCFSLGALVDVHLRTYTESDGRIAVQVDVEGVAGISLASRMPCGLCFQPPEAGPVPRKQEHEWDLDDDPHGLTAKVTYETTDISDVEISPKIPEVELGGLIPGLSMNRSIMSSCVATYTFPGHACFRSYHEVPRRLDLPFWGRF